MRGTISALLVAVALASAPALAEDARFGYAAIQPADDAYVLTSPSGSGHNWGRPVFVRYLTLVAREWLRRHPEGPRLRIGERDITPVLDRVFRQSQQRIIVACFASHVHRATLPAPGAVWVRITASTDRVLK